MIGITDGLIGITDGFPWQYRALSDELVVMSGCQCFPLKRYRKIGQPISPKEVRGIADRKVQEDFADLKHLEQQAFRPKVKVTS